MKEKHFIGNQIIILSFISWMFGIATKIAFDVESIIITFCLFFGWFGITLLYAGCLIKEVK